MFNYHFQREWSALWTSPLRLCATLFFAVICAWSVADGLAWQKAVVAAQADSPAYLGTDRDEWFADLASIESGEKDDARLAQPIGLTFRALRPPSALSPLAHRAEPIQPHSAQINGWRSEASLFRQYEVEGPSALKSGRVDLVFAVTVFLPLLLLLLTFDVLSRERQAGRLRMLLVQGAQPRTMLTARIVATLIPLTLIPVLAVLFVAFVNGAEPPSVMTWLLGLIAYALFWAAVASLVAALFRKPVIGALAVLAAWSILVVFIPSATQFFAQSLYPVPSKVTYLSEAREAEADTRRNLEERTELYLAEHVGMTDVPVDGVPFFYRRAYLSNIDINAETAPIMDRFEQQQARQRDFVRIAQFLSPTLTAKRFFEHISETGPENAAHYRRQARDHLAIVLEAIGPATVNQTRLSTEEAKAIPQFDYRALAFDPLAIMAMLFLIALALLMTFSVSGRLRSLN